ncbi:MAG: hypothetical protein GY940_20045 [bacterium]|nr:hypothetical protein [bacterium]
MQLQAHGKNTSEIEVLNISIHGLRDSLFSDTSTAKRLIYNFHLLSRFSHMPRMILVAVPTVDRERDLLPTRVDNWPPAAASDKFRAFIKKELIPHVEKKYRVRPYRILCGHSYGGVFCFDVFLKDPDMFTAFISIRAGGYGKRHWRK